MKNKVLYPGLLAAILASLFIFSGETDAQTKRRKKIRKPRTVVSTVQQSPETVPVSENRSVYLDGNQIVLGELPQQTETNSEVHNTPNDNSVETPNLNSDSRINDLSERIKSLESSKNKDKDEKQKRLALNLDILSKAETRAESLRKQLFDVIEKESSVRLRLEQIQNDARPEVIERSTALLGSLRPEEIRDQRKKSLEIEKRNLETLLTQIEINRASLEENVQKADLLVEKVRLKLDKEIDEALTDTEENQ